MSDPRAERSVTVGGQRVTLRYDFNAMIELEDALGVTGLGGVGLIMSDLGFNSLVTFVWAGMLHERPDLTRAEVVKRIGTDGIDRFNELADAVVDAFNAALPDDDDEGEDAQGERPTKGTGDSPSSAQQ